MTDPLFLILAGIVLLALFGGQKYNPTELVLNLLRALKLVPEAPLPPAEQLFRAYTQRAWEALQKGDSDGAGLLLDNGLAEASAGMADARAIVPTSPTLVDWLKSPLVIVLICLGVWVLAGGLDGCRANPQDSEQEALENSVTPAVWTGTGGLQILPVSDSHYNQVLRAYQLQQTDAPEAVFQVPPPDEPEAVAVNPVDAIPPTCTAGQCPATIQRSVTVYRSRARFWQRGPIRRGLAGVFRARPLARLFGRR